MWGIAGDLDDHMINSIARYYAAQPPASGKPGDPTLIAKGKQLFEQGVPDRSIPACATCHGADVAGVADFPRLAGQHAKYVVKQIAQPRIAPARGLPLWAVTGFLHAPTPDSTRPPSPLTSSTSASAGSQSRHRDRNSQGNVHLGITEVPPAQYATTRQSPAAIGQKMTGRIHVANKCT